MTREKFKLEIELDVDYDLGDMDIATYPYTQVQGSLDRKGNVIITTDKGTVVDFHLKRFSHIDKKDKE